VPARLLERVRSAFWFVPATCVVAAAGLALALVQLDEKLQRDGGGVAFAGGPESARSLLSAIASSMLTLTALVFSITVVVLQLTSSQFSPRVLRTFLRDRQNQLTLGVFTATFVYALMALREVRGQDGLVDLFVPGITISVAFGLVLVSVALFVAYIHHIVNSIRVVTIIDRIRIETESTIDRLAERDAEAAPLPPAPDGPSETSRRPARGRWWPSTSTGSSASPPRPTSSCGWSPRSGSSYPKGRRCCRPRSVRTWMTLPSGGPSSSTSSGTLARTSPSACASSSTSLNGR